VPVIKIKAKASHHGLFLLVVGCAILLVAAALSAYFWQALRLVLIYVILVAMVIILIGVLKRLEPKYSFILHPQQLHYYHKYGCWQLRWQQIQHISPIKETRGLSLMALPYLGIKLYELESVVQQISPRLANRLIHEQKPLIAFAIVHQLMTFEQGQLNLSPYKLRSGELVKGPLAAFLHHSQSIYNSFGYHLVIAQSSLDRDLAEFCQLLKQCKASAHRYL